MNLRIKELMNEKKITGRMIADCMGKTPQYVSNILNGRGMSLNALVELARILDVEVRDLFSPPAIKPKWQPAEGETFFFIRIPGGTNLARAEVCPEVRTTSSTIVPGNVFRREAEAKGFCEVIRRIFKP